MLTEHIKEEQTPLFNKVRQITGFDQLYLKAMEKYLKYPIIRYVIRISRKITSLEKDAEQKGKCLKTL